MKRFASALLLGPLLAACALSPVPAEATLADRGSAREVDATAAAALAASKAAPADVELAIAAARSLFTAADLRLQQATLQVLDRAAAPAIDAVLAADDAIVDPDRAAILSLCAAGLEAAERAAGGAPEAVAPRLYTGLHLSLVAWANGPARSLFAGYGPRLVAAIDAAIERDAAFDNGAPLRLSGRFRSRAPWPYGDVTAAVASLRRAVAIAPVAVNHLFLGDALWAAADRAAARREWTEAAAAAGDASTRWSVELLRELARRRLAATAGVAGG